MLTERDKYLGIRYATEDEINDYLMINKLFDSYNDEFINRVIDAISDYLCAYKPVEVHRAYNRAYYYAKKLGVTVSSLTNWYTTE